MINCYVEELHYYTLPVTSDGHLFVAGEFQKYNI